MALVNYWVIGTNRETQVVIYERKFVLDKDAQLHRADMAKRFPADEYHIQPGPSLLQLSAKKDVTGE